MDHETFDTAETLLDSAADAATIKQYAIDPDAPTHKLDPRAYAPLRVCPQCSLAWESMADWCPSCGTAFNARDRDTENQASGPAVTRVRPGRTGESNSVKRSPRARRAASAGTTRNTGERAAAHPPRARSAKSRAVRQPQPRRGGGAGWFVAVLAIFMMIPVALIAFTAGQESRPSKAEVNDQINQAVQQTKNSAVNSFRRNFQKQRDRLQAQFAERVAAAEKQAYAEGKANAEAQRPAGSLTDDLKRCVQNFLLDC